MDLIAAARAAWHAWAGELEAQAAIASREPYRLQRAAVHADQRLRRHAAQGHSWAINELRRRGVGDA